MQTGSHERRIWNNNDGNQKRRRWVMVTWRVIIFPGSLNWQNIKLIECLSPRTACTRHSLHRGQITSQQDALSLRTTKCLHSWSAVASLKGSKCIMYLMFSMQKTNCVIGFAFFVYVSAAPCVLCIITVLHTWWAGIRMWRCCLSGCQSEATSCLEVGSSEFEELIINRYLIWLKAEEAPVCCCLWHRKKNKLRNMMSLCRTPIHQVHKRWRNCCSFTPQP